MFSFVFFLSIFLTLEHADTPSKRETGLMGRKELQENSGMLFTFEKEGIHSFWAKGCLIPLSLAFLAADGTVTEIVDLECYPNQSEEHFFLKRAKSPKKAIRYALEVNQGWFTKNGIKPGDRFAFEGERGFFQSGKAL